MFIVIIRGIEHNKSPASLKMAGGDLNRDEPTGSNAGQAASKYFKLGKQHLNVALLGKLFNFFKAEVS